jgi:hypothetical protein
MRVQDEPDSKVRFVDDVATKVHFGTRVRKMALTHHPP